jgi:hypothetical protein
MDLPDGRTAKVNEFHTKPGPNVVLTGLLKSPAVRGVLTGLNVSIFQSGNGLFVRAFPQKINKWPSRGAGVKISPGAPKCLYLQPQLFAATT